MMSSVDEYRYDRMSQEHLQQVGALHEECFPGYYLTNLGPSFLRASYSWYVQSPEAIARVALDRGGSLVGFVAGTADESNYRRSLFRETWWRMAIALAQRFISKPVLTLRLMGERRDLVWQGLSTILTRRSRQAEQTDADSHGELSTASLVSIGVKPSCRRSGLGTALTQLFVLEARGRGCERITLSVRDDNIEARRFYESMNWEEVSKSSQTYHGCFSITYQKDYDG